MSDRTECRLRYLEGWMSGGFAVIIAVVVGLVLSSAVGDRVVDLDRRVKSLEAERDARVGAVPAPK